MLNLRAFDRTAQSSPMRCDAVDIGTSACSAITTHVHNAVDIQMRGGTTATFITFTGLAHGAEHSAVRFGTADNDAALLVRMHSECITGDLFGSLRCDCGAQLTRSMEMLQERGGNLLYLRQEGRGIGLQPTGRFHFPTTLVTMGAARPCCKQWASGRSGSLRTTRTN